MKNTSFIFYASFYEATQCLSKNRQGVFLCRLLDYMTSGDEPIFLDKEKIERSLFLLMQPQIKANLARRENGQAGAEHGKKGGRPKKDIDANADTEETKAEEEPENAENSDTYIEEKGNGTSDAEYDESLKYGVSGFQTESPRKNLGDIQGLHDVNPKITPNDNVNVNVNVNDNANDNGNEECPETADEDAHPAEKSVPDFPPSSPPAANNANSGKANAQHTAQESVPKTDTPKTGEPLRLAELLRNLHKEHDSAYSPPKKHIEAWAADIEKLHRIDRRDYADIERVIRWVKTAGNFWLANIMSGAKLREKFPTLLMQMTQRQTPHFRGRECHRTQRR